MIIYIFNTYFQKVNSFSILALIMDVYQNGTHPMDESSLKIILKTMDILNENSLTGDEDSQRCTYYSQKDV